MSNPLISQVSSAPEYCLLWIDMLCMPRSDWVSWVQAFGSIAAIVGSVFLVKWQHRLSTHADDERRKMDVVTKTESLGPYLLTAAHYIERACTYAEKGDRTARMDITAEKLQRALAYLNIPPLDNPSAVVSEAVNSLTIALGRAISGLNQWNGTTGQGSESGIRDLQTARELSRKALKLLNIHEL